MPSINFSNLDPNQPNGSHWDETRTKVFSALETYGCFNTIYDGVESELNETLFGSVMPKMSELPLERKQMSEWGTHFGYHGKITDVEYESIEIRDAVNPISMEQFAQMLYPNGNQLFSNTVSSYAQRLATLDQIVERMIFQTLSIDKHYDCHLDSLVYGFHLSVYGDLQDKEAKVSLPSNLDPNFITVIYQHGIPGLEVLSKDGDWIRVFPSYDSFTIMIGESMTVLSNGRLQAPFHRVS
ncbi:hypothetical protein LUZ60_003228 [Juncus effusus]|nr:hypothetical protein LUZ60_003228 [Juncus effusus]